MIPENLELETTRVRLKPLVIDDRDELLELAQQDPDMWYYFTLNLADPVQMDQWMQATLAEKHAHNRRPFAIIDKTNNRLAGSMSMLNISFYDKRLEIGSSWLGREFRGNDVNRHAKYCMMRYAFEELGFERVEFKTDMENARARKGLEKIGGTEEGILRSHMTMWNNRRRSSVYYSVLRNEWATVKGIFFKGLE